MYLDDGTELGYFKVSIKHSEKTDFIKGSPLKVIVGTVIKITATNQVFYYDKNEQQIELKLVIFKDISTGVQSMANEMLEVQRTYK